MKGLELISFLPRKEDGTVLKLRHRCPDFFSHILTALFTNHTIGKYTESF